MGKNVKKVVPGFLLLLVSACGYRVISDDGWFRGVDPGVQGGIAWGEGSFDSNGEQIYFTSINEGGDRIGYAGGPSGGMMMGGYLSCASCHGPDGRGGRHVMQMQVMDAPSIRWPELASEGGEEHEADELDEQAHEGQYGFEQFRRAVVEGEHPDGEALSRDMPRWKMGGTDVRDLMDYLMSIP